MCTKEVKRGLELSSSSEDQGLLQSSHWISLVMDPGLDTCLAGQQFSRMLTDSPVFVDISRDGPIQIQQTFITGRLWTRHITYISINILFLQKSWESLFGQIVF